MNRKLAQQGKPPMSERQEQGVLRRRSEERAGKDRPR
jgi:hypothetical protein